MRLFTACDAHWFTHPPTPNTTAMLARVCFAPIRVSVLLTPLCLCGVVRTDLIILRCLALSDSFLRSCPSCSFFLCFVLLFIIISVKLFRPDENAKRIKASAERILMEPPPAELFIKACKMAVNVSVLSTYCSAVRSPGVYDVRLFMRHREGAVAAGGWGGRGVSRC